mgnify:FL=1
MVQARRGDLSEEEKGRPYAGYYYREPAPVPGAILEAINGGPIDPLDALSFSEINRLLEPGYLPKETGHCIRRGDAEPLLDRREPQGQLAPGAVAGEPARQLAPRPQAGATPGRGAADGPPLRP